MSRTQALVQIIGLANQANDRTTYDYLLSEAESIMSRIRDEQVKYCDLQSCSQKNWSSRTEDSISRLPLQAKQQFIGARNYNLNPMTTAVLL